MRRYFKGDIVEIFRKGHDIAHGCNCFHLMGAGVAGQLAKNFKQIPGADKCQTASGNLGKLGTFSIAKSDDGLATCYNLYTQYEPGPNVDYGAIFNAFHDLAIVRANEKRPLFIPRIGAGIAGGDWDLIENLIKLAAPKMSIVVVEYGG